MRVFRGFLVLAIALITASSALAQEGHPLTGTWYGDFGMTSSQRNDLTVVMSWDGNAVTGTVNPGPNAVPLKVAILDPKPATPAAPAPPTTAAPPAGGAPGAPGAAGAQGGRGGGGRGGGRGAAAPIFNVHFEVDAKNKAGGIDHFVFDGKIENPVGGNRHIVGTWTCGATKGDFKIRRY